MYLEDFFALIKFIREDEQFTQKIVTYWANKVNRVSNSLEKLDEESLLKAFMIPSKKYVVEIMKEQSDEIKSTNLRLYEEGTKKIITDTKEVLAAFKKYRFYYNQYKHGLTVALKPFGGTLDKKTIEERKNGLFGLPICYDNQTIETMFEDGRLPSGSMMIPNLTADIQGGISQLQKEKNLLRYYLEQEVHINDLIKTAVKIQTLIRTLILNRYDYVRPKYPKGNTFSLPHESRKNFEFVEFTLIPEEERVLPLSDYRVNL